MRNIQPDVVGWLQDAASIASEIHSGLMDGSIPDKASIDDDWDIEQSARMFLADCERYKRACLKARDNFEADPGPLQSERV